MVVSPLVALVLDQVQSLRAVASIISTSKRILKSLLASESDVNSVSILCCTPEAPNAKSGASRAEFCDVCAAASVVSQMLLVIFC